MRIAIVGAGIGGLSAAALLDQAGHDVVLVEKAHAFGEVGAGIQITPNASRVIAALGLADELAAIGTTAERVVVRRWADDTELMSTPVGSAHVERYGHPYYNVYRPDLIELLSTAVDGVELRFGADVTAVAQDDNVAHVVLADGETIEADIVVGADGIKSTIRTTLFGDAPGRFSGWLAYRALVPQTLVPDLAIEITNRVGPDRHLVSYFIGRDQQFLNLVCVVPEASWDLESWNEPGDLRELRSFFDGWSAETASVLDKIVEPVHKWALYDREPLSQWTEGRITLLGDSCHPMVPFMAQGACMAIEDGAVLVRCLDHVESPPDALKLYERLRRPRTAKMQLGSWRNCTTFHLPDGPEQQARDDFYAQLSGAGADVLAAFDDVRGYDALTTSLTPTD